jgi:predicted DNA-binding transcriptional regulator YafY
MEQKFSLDLTPEEGILLLTGARLLDKLVAGISIHAKDRDELIRDIIEKITDHIPPALAGLSDEIAEAIVESVVGSVDYEDDELARITASSDMDELEAEQSPCNYPMYPTDKILPILEQAIIKHQTVRAHYYSFARESVDLITLNPLAILKDSNLWKMVAYCDERGETMVFRVDRIKELLQTTMHFEVPKNFNPRQPLPFAS